VSIRYLACGIRLGLGLYFKIVGADYPHHFLNKDFGFTVLADVGVNFKSPVVGQVAGFEFAKNQMGRFQRKHYFPDYPVAERVEFSNLEPAPKILPAVSDTVHDYRRDKVGVFALERFGVRTDDDFILPFRFAFHETQNFRDNLFRVKFQAERTIEK